MGAGTGGLAATRHSPCRLVGALLLPPSPPLKQWLQPLRFTRPLITCCPPRDCLQHMEDAYLLALKSAVLAADPSLAQQLRDKLPQSSEQA
jgi:hypothetical protein